MQSSVEITKQQLFFTLNDKKFIPAIYDGNDLQDVKQKGFNCIKITLDASLDANLKWDSIYDTVDQLIRQKLYIYWELDFGLFSQLEFPLSNRTQYLSLCLAIDHFLETIWQKYHMHSIGVGIFRGSADFSSQLNLDIEQRSSLYAWLIELFKSDEAIKKTLNIAKPLSDLSMSELQQSDIGQHLLRLYCRGITRDYFDLLATRFPDDIPLFLLLDTSSYTSAVHLMQILRQPSYDTLYLILKGEWTPPGYLTWDMGPNYVGFIGQQLLKPSTYQPSKIGIVIPDKYLIFPEERNLLEQAILKLKNNNQLFRVLYEEDIHNQWDGIDHLIIDSKYLAQEGMRKVAGFLATGGNVVDLQKDDNFSLESSFVKLLQ